MVYVSKGCNGTMRSSMTAISNLGENASRDNNSYVTKNNALVPVINLSSDYVYNMSGEGTISSPYEVR